MLQYRSIYDAKKVFGKVFMKKYLRFSYPILAVLFTLMLYFILFVSAFELACYNNSSYYRKEFKKFKVEESLKEYRGEEIPLSDLENVMRETLRYLRGDRENLLIPVSVNGESTEFYQEDEASHMADVRVLFTTSLTLRTMFILSCLAILFFLLILEHGKAFYILGKGFLFTSIGLLSVLLLLSLYAVMHFDTAFTEFHHIFFAQGNWEFDPTLSRMIDIMPEEFFADTALRILMHYLFLLVFPFLVSFFFVKRARDWGYPKEV